jgi:26S proteasome regulatory subunit N1
LRVTGKGDAADSCIQAASASVNESIKKFLELTMQSCAYAGSGSVDQIQSLLGVIGEHIEDDEKDPMKNIHQEVAVLGIALMSMGEDLGVEMIFRALDNILQYGELNIKRSVPLALGLASLCNPRKFSFSFIPNF